MQIVININENDYKSLMINGGNCSISIAERIIDSVYQGEKLPKGHGRKFEEIVVEYPPKDLCTYPEYRGKPYFSIKYEENGEHFIGFGTYKPEVLSRYLQEDFIIPIIIEAQEEQHE